MDSYSYGEGFYAYNSDHEEEYKEEHEEELSKVFKDEEDKNKYVLMLAGYWKPKQEKTSRDRYDDMLSRK